MFKYSIINVQTEVGEKTHLDSVSTPGSPASERKKGLWRIQLHRPSWLLPNRIKRIGCVILVLTTLTSVTLKNTKVIANPEELDLIITVLKSIFMISLLGICMAADKVEDERTNEFRMKSCLLVIIAQVLYTCFMKLADKLMPGAPTDFDPYVMCLVSLLVFLAYFNFLKWRSMH